MANGLTSFLGGLAGGYINESRYRDNLDRQDKLDIMREQEFALRKRQLEGQVADQDLERSNKKAELEAGRDVNVEDGSALQVGGNLYDTDAESAANSAQAIEQANAQLSPQEQIPTGAVAQTKQVGGKRFLADPTGIAAATAYQTEANSEDGRVKRKAAVISDLRGPEAAQKFLTDWQDNKAKLYDAQRGALWNTVSSMAAQKDYKGISDAYEHYKDGNRLTFAPQPDGSVTATHLGKDGKPLGQFVFKTPTELQGKLYEAMYPDKLMEQRRAAEVKRQEELAKVHAVAPGVELRTGAGDLLAKNNTLTWAEARADGLGGYGGGTGGKPIGPDIVTMKDDHGDYLYDKNSNARGVYVPATDAVPEETSWFGANKPAKPATPGGIQWTRNGVPIADPQSYYQQLPVNRTAPQGGIPQAAGPKNAWNDATGEVISNGRVIGKAKSPAEARALLSKQPKPAANSEQVLRSKMTGDMGADPAAIAREIQAATLGLQSVKDPASAAQLRDYIASLQGQLQNIKG